jgi:hypothetical protein
VPAYRFSFAKAPVPLSPLGPCRLLVNLTPVGLRPATLPLFQHARGVAGPLSALQINGIRSELDLGRGQGFSDQYQLAQPGSCYLNALAAVIYGIFIHRLAGPHGFYTACCLI